ncbi:thymidine phosphorylase [Abyssibius alkaniclasticus]|uniref:thymidine phosphorylase n=1 Tax=Abyssibius alkaniclasticus TaxID=2881234 RepID=UPI00236495DA|nr:thymidine phosphorylase [Abyssibius alkaniclasticus]UPH70812.1 thymidine phosphorylase [Abyssibius alkaniclasticus]
MLTQEIIALKRDGGVLPQAAIAQFVAGITDGSISEGQAAAFAMAVFFQKMSIDERVALTCAMRDSGDVLTWAMPGPVVDKHSTGGVGDNVSLMLAPALAACGAYVPMISGRGLGHTGGTLDKFDAIPGYNTQPDIGELRRVVGQVGCAIIGQTGEIAPADKRLYGIRDVTATVESIDLITASILSKKLAAGLEHLVLDVKFGSGAFMATAADARALAESLVQVANGAGCTTTALLTDMNQPLASAAGNALEMANAVAFLRGNADARLYEVTVALCADLLHSAGLAESLDDARAKVNNAYASGAAAEKFAQMVAALGGPADFMDAPEKHMEAAPIIMDYFARTEGHVAQINTRAVGQAVVELGGGRRRAADAIDYAVGLDRLASLGAKVDAHTPIARIHARSDAGLQAARARLDAAYTIGDAPAETPLVLERIAP